MATNCSKVSIVIGRMRRRVNREQRKRRHHHDADDVADPIAQRRPRRSPDRQQPGGDRQAHIARRDHGRAHHGDSHQQNEIAHRGERRIETEDSAATRSSARSNSRRRRAGEAKISTCQGMASC